MFYIFSKLFLCKVASLLATQDMWSVSHKDHKDMFFWWSETSAKLLLVPVGTECLSKTESDPWADSLGKNDRTRPRMHSSLAIVPRRIALGELGYQGYKTTTVRLSWLLIRWLFVCVQFLFLIDLCAFRLFCFLLLFVHLLVAGCFLCVIRFV